MAPASVANRLLYLEQRLGLLRLTVGGIRFWEQVRNDVAYDVSQALGATGEAHPGQHATVLDRLRRIGGAARNLVANRPASVGPRSIVVFGHSRRARGPDGLWWDIYCDPVTAAMADDEFVHLESFHRHRHARPAKTRNLVYLDALALTARVQRLVRGAAPLTAAEQQVLLETEQAVRREFGVPIDLAKRVRHLLDLRRATLPFHRRFLRKVKPRLAVVVVSYGEGKAAFIEACQEQGIPVAELQHGIIHKEHLGYAFPHEPKRLFPDYLLTFGPRWADAAPYPLPPERVLAVGNPYFTLQKARHKPSGRRDRLLFLSQGTVGDRLSRVAVALGRLPGIRITYKLHPSEFRVWKGLYPWLAASTDVEVVADAPPMYALFAESFAQVGVNSTALFEGLGYGLETFLMDGPGVDAMEVLTRDGQASIVASAEELKARVLHEGRTPTEAREQAQGFMREADGAQVAAVLRRLASHGRPAAGK